MCYAFYQKTQNTGIPEGWRCSGKCKTLVQGVIIFRTQILPCCNAMRWCIVVGSQVTAELGRWLQPQFTASKVTAESYRCYVFRWPPSTGVSTEVVNGCFSAAPPRVSFSRHWTTRRLCAHEFVCICIVVGHCVLCAKTCLQYCALCCNSRYARVLLNFLSVVANVYGKQAIWATSLRHRARASNMEKGLVKSKAETKQETKANVIPAHFLNALIRPIGFIRNHTVISRILN